MSLRFVFGGSGSGKSTTVYEEVIRRAKQETGRNFLIIVPDQFTLQTQKELVTHPANKCGGIMNIDVLSFGRLTHRIFEEVGRKQHTVLDDTGKSLVLRGVAQELADELPYLGGKLDKQGYIHEVKSAISEFKQYGIAADDLDKLIAYADGKGALKAKLKDLQVLYRGFQDAIRDRFVTTEETLDLLCQALEKSAIVKESVVVFDGFTGFTPIQYRVIEKLLLLTEEVIMTLTCDANPEQMKSLLQKCEEQHLFYLTVKTVRDLEKIAARNSVERGEDTYINYSGKHRFEQSPALAHLEQALFRYPVAKYTKGQDEIVMMKASSVEEEVRQVGIRIRKLLMEKEYEFRDIAIVTGSMEAYGEPIAQEFKKLGIPCFLDTTTGMEMNPLIEYIKSALYIIENDFSYRSMFRYLRSGMSCLTAEETDVLEQYCVQTGMRGRKAWTGRLTHKTAAMRKMAKEEPERAESVLEYLDSLRSRVAEELSPLMQSGIVTGEQWVKALYDFLQKSDAAGKIAGYAEMFHEEQDLRHAAEYDQVYRKVMILLEQVYDLQGKTPLKSEEFTEILEAGFGEIRLGAIPQNVDRVVVGDIERTRLKNIKVLFFMGVNDGNIPGSAGKGGIISDLDREFLRDCGTELAPSPRQQMFIQRLYLYLNLTKPSEKLVLSYSAMSREGKALRPAYLVETIHQLFPDMVVEVPEKVQPEEQIMTREQGLPYLAAGLRDYAAGFGEQSEASGNVYSLYEAYKEQQGYEEVIGELQEAAFFRYEGGKLSKETALALYGEILRNSVTRLESFAECAYRQFLQFGMGLTEKEEFSFDNRDMGILFHGVLEEFSRELEHSDYTWFTFTKDYAKENIHRILEAQAAVLKEEVLFSSARNAYAVTRMERILNRTVNTLQYQLQKGKFAPMGYELSFEEIADSEQITFTLGEKEKMRLLGKIDRLDTYERDGKIYVKIMDYKSSDKSFEIAALYYGMKLQLVVYMNAAVESIKRRNPDKEVVPAAMLYYHVSDPAAEISGEKSPEEIESALRQDLSAKGAINCSDDIPRLLDADSTKKSDVVDFAYKADGSLSKKKGVLTTGEMQAVSGFVNRKIMDLGRQILEGRIDKDPYVRGNGDDNGCRYCAFKGVCGFDKRLPGYRYRELTLSDDAALEAIMNENSGEE